MRDVEPPTRGGRLQRSVTACLAAVLELETDDVPLPDEQHPQPWTVWRTWLSQRALGLVPIADPVEAGYLVAPADVALWLPSDRGTERDRGTVDAIVLGPAADADLRSVEAVRAHAGRGLEGDRYFEGRGTFSNVHSRGHDLTLIEAEVLDALTFPVGRLAPEDARRNVVTRGIDLNALVGKRFRVGGVECLGQRLCEPCAHLERWTARAGKPGTLRALIHKGGLRADVLSDGEICVGDAITAC